MTERVAVAILERIILTAFGKVRVIMRIAAVAMKPLPGDILAVAVGWEQALGYRGLRVCEGEVR